MGRNFPITSPRSDGLWKCLAQISFCQPILIKGINTSVEGENATNYDAIGSKKDDKHDDKDVLKR